MGFMPGVYFSTSSGTVARWGVGTNQYSVVASTGLFLTDIAFDPAGNLFGITYDSLFAIDAVTGTASRVGSLTGPLYAGSSGLTGANGFDISSTGVALISSGNNNIVAQVDLGTGAVRNAGLVGVGSAGDVAFDGTTATVATGNYTLVDNWSQFAVSI